MQPRPLHVLAVAQLTAAAAAMYTLQTRLHHSAAEDELSKVRSAAGPARTINAVCALAVFSDRAGMKPLHSSSRGRGEICLLRSLGNRNMGERGAVSRVQRAE